MRFLVITGVVSLFSFTNPILALSTPNIVFILIDDLGWKDLGCYGSTYYETPNIDKLANTGVMFTDAYAMPTSAPSRASLMTGKYPPKTGIYTVDAYASTPVNMQKIKGIKSKKFIDEREVTLAEVLKQAGYTNGHFGKWHLGDKPETYPLSQGFDVNVAGCESGAPKSYFAPFVNIKNIAPQDSGTYLTDVLMREALQFMEDNKLTPFFLYFPFYEVHVPLHSKKKWVDKYNNKEGDGFGQNVAEYAAMISYVDHCVGEMISYLDKLQLVDNTIIIITSDNGGQIVSTSNLPLRGQKGNLYEGGIRVPLIVNWLGKVSPGAVVDTPVSIIDFYPTLAEIAGVSRFCPHDIDGESLISLLFQQDNLKRSALYWHLISYNGNGRTNSKLWQFPGGAIRKGEWKLIENFENGDVELYNLMDDIGETNNLAEIYPDIKFDLLKELKNWQKKYKALIPDKSNPHFDIKSESNRWTNSNIRNNKELQRLKLVR